MIEAGKLIICSRSKDELNVRVTLLRMRYEDLLNDADIYDELRASSPRREPVSSRPSKMKEVTHEEAERLRKLYGKSRQVAVLPR